MPTRPARLAVTRRVPRTLDAGQVAAILAACEHLRDRFLLALLAYRQGHARASSPRDRRMKKAHCSSPLSRRRRNAQVII